MSKSYQNSSMGFFQHADVSSKKETVEQSDSTLMGEKLKLKQLRDAVKKEFASEPKKRTRKK